MSKISVIMPVYKAEKYLERSVTSVLNQTHTDFELLLIDDGSPDNSGAICDEWAKKDNRIRVFHKPNGGTSDARNFGIEKAQGEYITFIDNDDYVLPHWLESMHNSAKNHNADIVKGGMQLFDETSIHCDDNSIPLDYSVNPYYKIIYDEGAVSALDLHKKLVTLNGQYNNVWNQLVKAEIHKKCLFPTGHLNEDYKIYFDLLTYAKTIYLIPFCGYSHGINPAGQSYKLSDSYIIDKINDYVTHYNILTTQFNEYDTAAEALAWAVKFFFWYLIPADNASAFKQPYVKDIWAHLYSTSKNINLKKILSPVLYYQYKIYTLSPAAYYTIMRIKKVISK